MSLLSDGQLDWPPAEAYHCNSTTHITAISRHVKVSNSEGAAVVKATVGGLFSTFGKFTLDQTFCPIILDELVSKISKILFHFGQFSGVLGERASLLRNPSNEATQVQAICMYGAAQPDFSQIRNQWRYQKHYFTSFGDYQKMCFLTKFGGCCSKNKPATPLGSLKWSRAWQHHFSSYTHQNL